MNRFRNLNEYEPQLRLVRSLVVPSYNFWMEDQETPFSFFSKYPKSVVVVRHSTPLSWVPVIFALTDFMVKNGFGHRVPIGVIDRTLLKIPLLKRVASFLTQGDQPSSFREAIEVMQSIDSGDFVVFPEGNNCFFGDARDCQPFRSTRFYDVAESLGVPILAIEHRGSENWAKSFDLQAVTKWKPLQTVLPRAFAESGVLTLPTLPKPVFDFHIRGKIFVPTEERITSASSSSRPEPPKSEKLRVVEGVRLHFGALERGTTHPSWSPYLDRASAR